MKSPFPGMDPYLERYWGDLHHRMIQYSCDALEENLPSDLRARVEERVFHDPITEGFIEISERSGGKVTVIEFLSPANKLPGTGRVAYRKKQKAVLRSHASLVEIDLVRRGPRSVSLPYDDLPAVSAATYVASIRPGWDRELYEVFPISLRERLPALPIPLRESEKRITLDLQPLVDHSYKAGRYHDTDYTQPPDPPLNEADAECAKGVLARPRE